jgi:glycosyltransferase involved in cell wall biosynthesis
MNSNAPRLIIGLPVYNGEAYVSEAIESLLKQTYRDFELIISDNASTDATELICRNYAKQDSRVRYVRQPINLGPVENFKFVLRISKAAEYFMWAASDDSWSSNWIESLVGEFKESDIGLFGGYREGEGAVIHPLSYSKGDHSRFFLDSDVTGKCLYAYAIFRREILNTSDFCFFDCPVGGDQIYLLHLLAKGGLRCVPGGVLSYRVHSASLSAQQRSARSRLWAVISRYPLAYYRMAFEAVPCQLWFVMPFLIVWKYFKEQVSLVMSLLQSAIRRANLLLKV